MMQRIAGAFRNREVRVRRGFGCAVLGLLFIGCLAAAQEPPESANDGFILFSTDRDNPSVLGMCPNCEEIYVMAEDGSEPRRLTNNNVNDNGPVWSHSKKLIAFHTNRSGLPEVWLMNGDGSDPRFLASAGPQGALFPSWSNDGNQLCFNSGGRPRREIFVVNVDGTGLTNISNSPGDDLRCDWSPKGDQIAFGSTREGADEEIYVMGADGSNPHRLTFTPGPDANPDWSPKGDRILFESNRDGNAEIYMMNADGSDPFRMTYFAGQDTKPSWSPKGDRIVFHRRISGHLQVFTMNEDGSAQTQVTFTSQPGYSGFPSWSKGKI